MINKIKTYFELIKFSHTIFALPFAVSSVFIVEKGIPEIEKMFWIVMALVFARTAGMAFNRYIDAPIDKMNPRTKNWPSAKGEIKPWEIMALGLVSSILFMFSSYNLNMLAFWLSPVVILLLLIYPAGKRFTQYVHLILGLVYFLIPVAVSIALKGYVEPASLTLGLAMAFWVSGFDILYALQDYEFDKSFGIYSIPAKYGIKKAILIARFFHFLTFVFVILTGLIADLGTVYFVGIFILSGFLVYEHLLIKENDLSKINKAFFTVNGFVSIIYMIFVILDVYI
ncbi:MAG TPA: 4-hydroxybenzoate octaprenyltransferase [Sulfurihydrogenibium azorense]|uniref:4-hydroxybenzoate polyprenyltransferase n=1 Tax=Sulfurihydrogenibium azorense TaxID=309806 RepID=A0A831YCX7_9AQUI|nr:MAG: 4-hydroxybenzoate octaprenyltransferase [Sulfurihydrogenibium sp.]HEV08963.1 4-hydroxybenzoate octaprenyltransferase [Sulfurihydrogenibium azorense]